MGFLIITYGCAIFFIVIGIFAMQKKTPMHFYSGTTVKADRISNVKAYNRANGIMWATYGATFSISGILAVLVNGTVGGIFMTICSTVGVIILVFTYEAIYRKYRI